MHSDQETNKLSALQEQAVGEILKFAGVGNKDVYNPAPLQTGDGVVLAGRMESRKNALDSEVVFFHSTASGVWEPIEGSPVFKLEDPFFTEIKGEIIFGGVQVEWDVQKNDAEPHLISFRTVFYRGKDIFHLKQFAAGPERMKDIRLVELANGQIGVFSRPQGEKGGKGKMGFTTVSSLEDITPQIIQAAPLLKDNFDDEHWGGANAVYLLPDGRLGVLGHIAHKDEKDFLHYRTFTFVYDAKTGKSTSMEIIATRDDFPKTQSKEPRLYDVVFPAGLIPGDGEDFELYTGLSDAYVGRLKIKDPFSV